MLTETTAVRNAWAASDRELQLKITINDQVFRTEDVTDFSYDAGAMNGESLTLGSTYANSIKITFSHIVENLKLQDKITPEIGIKLPDDTWNYTKLGVFIIDSEVKQDRNNGQTSLSATDNMIMLSGNYVPKIAYPAGVIEAITDIANQAGVKLNEANIARLTDTTIGALGKEATYRQAIGYVAQIAGGFAQFNRDGLLDIRGLEDPNFRITPDCYMSKGLTKNETFYRIGGMQAEVTTTQTDNDGNENQETVTLQSGSPSGSQIKLTNPAMSQQLLDQLYDQYADINFYPYSLEWFADPNLEAGDWVTIVDNKGNEFKTPALGLTLSFNGGLSGTLKADTTVTSQTTFAYGGQLSQIVTKLHNDFQNIAGNHIYKGIDQPLFAKKGDLWYQSVGPDTVMQIYQFDPNTGLYSWVEVGSTKPSRELSDQMDQVKKDITDQTAKIDDAVTNANNAVSNSDLATKTANAAKQSAADAVTVSNQANLISSQAQASALTASSDALTALTNSKTAVTNAKTALDSSTATNKSVTSLVTKVDDIAGTITTLATQKTVDAINKTVSENTVKLAATATSAQLAVTQTQVNTISGTVKNQGVSIDVLTQGLKLKADQDTVNTVTGDVTKLKNTVDLQANQLAAKLERTDVTSMLSGYATQTWAQNQINLTANGWEEQLSTVQAKYNDISQSQGRNYVRNSRFDSHMDNWYVTAAGILTMDTTQASQTNLGKMGLHIYGTTTDNFQGIGQGIPLKMTKGQKFVIGMLQSFDGSSSQGLLRIGVHYRDSNGNILSQEWHDFKCDVGWSDVYGRNSFVFTTKDDCSSINFMIYAPGANYNLNAYITEVSLTLGPTSFGWQEAPEDTATYTDTKVANLKLTVDGMKLDISNKIEQTDLNGYATQSWSQGQISAAKNEITASVQNMTSDMATQTWTQGKLDLTANGLTSQISSVENGLSTKYTILEQTLKGVQVTANNAVTQSQYTQLAGQFTSLIESADNKVRKPWFDDGESGTWNNPSTEIVSGPDSNVQKLTGHSKYLKLFGRDNYEGGVGWFSVTPGEVYYFSGYMGSWGTTYAVGVGLNFITKDRKNSWVKATGFPANSKAPISAITGSITVPAGVGRARTWVQIDGPAKTDLGYAAISGLRISKSASSSQITQLANDINLRVKTGDLISQINLSAGSTLIKSNKIYLSAASTVFGGSAFIPAASIKDLSADYIKTGTLDASKVNLISVNAASITAGIITGDNLSINLDSGEVLFQKGSIKSATNGLSGVLGTDGILDIEIEDGTFTQGDKYGNGIRFENGGMYFAKSILDWKAYDPTTGTYFPADYGKIKYENSFLNSVPGMSIRGSEGIVVGTDSYLTLDPFAPYWLLKGSGISAGQQGVAVASEKKAALVSGQAYYFSAFKDNPYILVGANNTYSAPRDWTPGKLNGVGGSGISMVAQSVVIKAQSDNNPGKLDGSVSGTLALACDGRSGYVLSTTTYNRTYSGSANMIITANGVYGRVTSARKYKLLDHDAETVIDHAKRVLDINPKQWFDKAEVETISKSLTESTENQLMSDYKFRQYYGFIADDFHDAGLDEVVQFKNGEVDSLAYDRIPMYHNVILKDHETRIEKLERENKELKQQLAAIS